MTRKLLLKELEKRFEKRFGIGNDVRLLEQICIIRDPFSGNGYMDAIRYDGVGLGFSYYENFWGGGWKSDKKIWDKYGIRALCDCLGLKVRKRVEYFIDGD